MASHPSNKIYIYITVKIGSWFNPRNVISVAVWIHSGPGSGPPPVAKVLPWFSVTAFVQSRFLAKGMNLVANKIHFVIAYLCQRAGGTQAIFMCKWMNSEIFIHDGLTFGQYSCIFTRMSMPYWNFEYKGCNLYTEVKVRGGMDQDPATEVTNLNFQFFLQWRRNRSGRRYTF